MNAAQLRGLVVSCQADSGTPLDDPDVIARVASAAVAGGAVAIRANGPLNVAAVRASVDVPVIGLFKRDLDGYDIRITPRLEDAYELAAAGCDMIALDATNRSRPGRLQSGELISAVVTELGVEVLADVDALDSGVEAAAAGAAAVATTLAGYTYATQSQSASPAIELVRMLAGRVDVPVWAEGRYNTPELAQEAIKAGAAAVIVGTAITAPTWIAAQFAAAVNLIEVTRGAASVEQREAD